MSWTVESHGQEPADINRLETAIHEAHKQKILMFCSTSDRGITGDKSYPGRLSECFEIGGADLNGEKLIWVDPEVNYLFPGKRIPFNNDDGKTYSYVSGSSLATACASGLAGLLLYCNRVLEDSAKDSLRKKETMTTMLNSLKAEKGGKFIDIKAKIVKAFITKLKFKDETTYRDVTAETIDKVDWNEDSEWALSAVMGPSQVSEED